MRKAVVFCSVAAAGLAVVAAAQAKGRLCAQSGEVFPVDTALIQQELMVAALTCHEVERFNSFQKGYGPELREADARLARMFSRMYGRRGETAYHAFKTKAANDAEMRSIHNNPAYCAEAGALLSAALVPLKPSLITFVSASRTVIVVRPIESCLSAGAEETAIAEVSVSGPVKRHHRRRHR